MKALVTCVLVCGVVGAASCAPRKQPQRAPVASSPKPEAPPPPAAAPAAPAKLSNKAEAALRAQAKRWLELAVEEHRRRQSLTPAPEPRHEWLVHMRERISHTPLQAIAVLRAEHGLGGVAAIAKLEPDVVLRSFVLQSAAAREHRHKSADAKPDIEHALQLLQNQADEKAKALLPLVLRTHSDILGRDATRATGIDMSSLPDEDTTIADAYAAAKAGDWKRAHELLDHLPSDAFQKRAAQAALLDDRGAEFYALAASAPGEHQTATKLLAWSCALGDLAAARALLAEHAKDPRTRAFGAWMLAQSFEDKLSAGERLELLEQAWTLTLVKPAPKWASELQARVVLELTQAAPDRARERMAVLLPSAHGQAWSGVLVTSALALGDLAAAQNLVAKLEDAQHAQLEIVAYLAAHGRVEDARAAASNLKGPLGKARGELSIAAALAHHGDQAAAKQAFAEAKRSLDAVKTTNAWFPRPDEANYKDVARLAGAIQQAEISAGYVAEAIASFKHDQSSIRDLAAALVAHDFQREAETWVSGFSEEQRRDGAQLYGYIGLAEGAATRLARPVAKAH